MVFKILEDFKFCVNRFRTEGRLEAELVSISKSASPGVWDFNLQSSILEYGKEQVQLTLKIHA